jgi:hypothetical protein
MRIVLTTLLATAAVTAQPASATLPPVTHALRIKWAVVSTVGASNLAGGLFAAGWGTAFNKPEEYGPHWEGYGKRYGMRLTGSATSNAMEAGLGALWGEDPRYPRLGRGASFGARLDRAWKYSFVARRGSGNAMPAYARYIAIPGSNFLANTWRAGSETQVNDALIRTGLGFAGRITANLFAEFWPDVQRRLFRGGR